MAEIFLISDTHFGHSNILNFTDKDGKKFRGDIFDDVHHMNETMVENWNRVVSPKDKIYHLGDVYFGSGEEAYEILSRLNGKKRLILGNHDAAKSAPLQKHFQKIELWKKWSDLGIILSHIPLHPDQLLAHNSIYPKPLTNIHGHIHQNDSPEGRYRNICVEKIDYTPIHIDKVRTR